MTNTEPNAAPPGARKHSHYFRDVSHLGHLDIYRVCELFIKNDPSGALAHAAKKILVAGGRGGKDIRKDLQEAIDALARKLEMLDEDDAAGQGQLPLGIDLASGPDMTVIAAVHSDPPRNDGPWYPDEKNDWVEVPPDSKTMPDGMRSGDLIEVLCGIARHTRVHHRHHGPSLASSVAWDLSPHHPPRVVAYRIVRKAVTE